MANAWPRILLLMATTAAGGCAAVPAGVKVASLVGDGISYATTGKSLTDHLISGAMHRDCALFRIVEGESICRADASVSPDSEGHDKPPAAVMVDAATVAPPPLPASYLVVGSFADPRHAERCRYQYRKFHASEAQDQKAFGTRYRVVVGPLADDNLEIVRRQLSANGKVRPWRLVLCPSTLAPPPCSAPAATVAQN